MRIRADHPLQNLKALIYYWKMCNVLLWWRKWQSTAAYLCGFTAFEDRKTSWSKHRKSVWDIRSTSLDEEPFQYSLWIWMIHHIHCLVRVIYVATPISHIRKCKNISNYQYFITHQPTEDVKCVYVCGRVLPDVAVLKCPSLGFRGQKHQSFYKWSGGISYTYTVKTGQHQVAGKLSFSFLKNIQHTIMY